MNKLTPQNFHELSKEIARIDIDSDELVIEVIDIIFEKACLEPNLAEASASMCKTVLTVSCSVSVYSLGMQLDYKSVNSWSDSTRHFTFISEVVLSWRSQHTT